MPAAAVGSLFAALSLAGSTLTILSPAALAQDASAAGCSGILCVFGSRPAPQPAQAAVTDPAARQESEAAPPAEANSDKTTDAKPDIKARPAKPTVTIAAETTEMERLKSLAAALPKEKVRIVSDSTPHAAADFSVATTLDQIGGSEKARLFTEQMHVVAGPSIVTLADLKDKVVSFGPDKGPSQAAARKAFAALGISVKEASLDLDNALDGVGTGDVDAVVVLAPQPLARLRSITGLHLVSWPDGAALPAGAVAASIDAASYPGLVKPGETIKAMGVDAVLTLNEKAARKPAAKSFLSDLSQHSGALARHGFDLIKADLETRSIRHVASDDRR